MSTYIVSKGILGNDISGSESVGIGRGTDTSATGRVTAVGRDLENG
jgi:hypothetical protein